MAWQYFAVCICDFIIFPLIAFYYAKETGNDFKWDPMTLKDSGFYHMTMGVIIGVSAWTRGQENILRTRLFAQTETQDNISPSIQGVDDEINEGLDPPKHPSKRRGG